ncbi:hypothetical protein AB3480_31800, partial [Rhizobium mongolense]|uniref:TRAFAC clade GTPase domain-containing protein n=1 Tax=Rhizobium mongolense TaxID=57676 RepID=UPI0034CCF2BE
AIRCHRLNIETCVTPPCKSGTKSRVSPQPDSRPGQLSLHQSADNFTVPVWLVADGRILSDRVKRQSAITRLGQLAGRLRSMMDGTSPKLLLVVTHRDVVEVEDAVLDRIRSEFTKHQLDAQIIPIAPFAEGDAVKPGFGLSTLITSSLEQPGE